MLRFLLILIMAIGLAVVVALSIEPTPSFQKVSWVPKEIARWADQHENFRHFPGYFLLTLLTLAAFAGAAPGRIFSWASSLILLAGALELAQLLVPRRSCDWADFLWGSAGVLAATFLWFVGVGIWAGLKRFSTPKSNVTVVNQV